MNPLLRLISLFCVLLPCLGLQAHDAPPPAPHVVPAQPTGGISGFVLCDDTQKAARGAVVMLIASNGADLGQSLTRTGLDGRYTFKRVPTGDYGLIASLPGYQNAMQGKITSPDQSSVPEMKKLYSTLPRVTVRDGEATAPDLTLVRGAAVSGHVLYSDGTPASQVNIIVEPVTDASQHKAGEEAFNAGAAFSGLVLQQTSSTDDQGHFRLAGFAPGKYTVSVQQSNSSADVETDVNDFPSLDVGPQSNLHSVRFFSEDTVHRTQAKVYDLLAGEEVSGVEIIVSPDALHSIRGTVTAPDGRPINSGSVRLQDPSDKSFSLQAAPDSEGQYIFQGIPNGTYQLSVPGASIQQVIPPTGQATVQGVSITRFADVSQSVIVKDGDVTLPLTVGKQTADSPDPPPTQPQ